MTNRETRNRREQQFTKAYNRVWRHTSITCGYPFGRLLALGEICARYARLWER